MTVVVYVANIPPDVTDQEFRHFFEGRAGCLRAQIVNRQNEYSAYVDRHSALEAVETLQGWEGWAPNGGLQLGLCVSQKPEVTDASYSRYAKRPRPAAFPPASAVLRRTALVHLNDDRRPFLERSHTARNARRSRCATPNYRHQGRQRLPNALRKIRGDDDTERFAPNPVAQCVPGEGTYGGSCIPLSHHPFECMDDTGAFTKSTPHCPSLKDEQDLMYDERLPYLPNPAEVFHDLPPLHSTQAVSPDIRSSESSVHSPPSETPCTTLHIGGLPPDITQRELAHVFRPFEGCLEIRLFDNVVEGKRRVSGFCCFETVAQASYAMKRRQGYAMDLTTPETMHLRISYARRKSQPMLIDEWTMSSMVFLKPHAPLRCTLSRTRYGLPRILNRSIERLAIPDEAEEAFLAEVGVKTDEDPDLTLTRFVREVRNTNVYNEVRRRKQFENRQDRVKRKRRERGMVKMEANYPTVTYGENEITGLVSPPFQEIFEERAEETESLFGENGYFSSPASESSVDEFDDIEADVENESLR